MYKAMFRCFHVRIPVYFSVGMESGMAECFGPIAEKNGKAMHGRGVWALAQAEGRGVSFHMAVKTVKRDPIFGW